MAFRRPLAVTLAAFAIPLALVACTGEDESTDTGAGRDTTENESTDTGAGRDTTENSANAHITLDESGCAYDGDETPKAPTFMLDVDKQVSGYAKFEVNRIPTNVSNEEVEAFFEAAQAVLAQGGEFGGPPETWRLINGGGQGTSTGSFRIGDPEFPDKMLVPGQRYVLWCSTGELSPTAVFLATVLEPTE